MLPIVVLLLAAVVLWWAVLRGGGRRLTAALALLALLSVAGYFRWGNLHSFGILGVKIVHYHDFYHYAFGSKYYAELGSSRLYPCTFGAFREMQAAGQGVPVVEQVRSQDLWEARPARELNASFETECRSSFTDARWAQFQGDLRGFLDLGWYTFWWGHMLMDAGFNPPPTYAAVASSLIRWVPITPTTTQWLAGVDYVFVLGIIPSVIWRVWGSRVALVYLVLFGSNWLASMEWTGGSFLRHPWFLFLLLGLAALKRRRFVLAGGALAASAGMRIFPLVFFGAAGLWLTHRLLRDRAAWTRPWLQFSVAGGVVLVGMVSASLALFGREHWVEFAENIQQHKDVFFVAHIGYKKLVVFGGDVARQRFLGEGGLERFRAWNLLLADRYAANSAWHHLVQGVAVVTTALAVRRRSAPVATVLLGTVILYFFAMPANYYYVYLAVLPAVFLGERATSGPRLVVARAVTVMVAVAAITAAPFLSRDDIVFNFYMNAVLLAAIVVLVGLSLVDRSDGELPAAQRQAPVSAASGTAG